MTEADSLPRCAWITNDLMRRYHDEEWGVPVHDDRTHFEYIVLDGAQAGLSWQTILDKREHYRNAFHHFDPHKVARYNKRSVERLLKNPGIIRNRLKIESAVHNAKALLGVQEAFGSFDAYIWQFTEGTTIINHWRSWEETPATSPESHAMSRDLKRRGFRFVGPIICYAYMQAAGMVNDHVVSCFRHHELARGAGRG